MRKKLIALMMAALMLLSLAACGGEQKPVAEQSSPKGNFQVNNKDVYWIQLYEVDDEGYILYDEKGNIKSSILMWKE